MDILSRERLGNYTLGRCRVISKGKYRAKDQINHTLQNLTLDHTDGADNTNLEKILYSFEPSAGASSDDERFILRSKMKYGLQTGLQKEHFCY